MTPCRWKGGAMLPDAIAERRAEFIVAVSHCFLIPIGKLSLLTSFMGQVLERSGAKHTLNRRPLLKKTSSLSSLRALIHGGWATDSLTWLHVSLTGSECWDCCGLLECAAVAAGFLGIHRDAGSDHQPRANDPHTRECFACLCAGSRQVLVQQRSLGEDRLIGFL